MGHTIESPLPFLGGEESFPPVGNWPVAEDTLLPEPAPATYSSTSTKNAPTPAHYSAPARPQRWSPPKRQAAPKKIYLNGQPLRAQPKAQPEQQDNPPTTTESIAPSNTPAQPAPTPPKENLAPAAPASKPIAPPAPVAPPAPIAPPAPVAPPPVAPPPAAAPPPPPVAAPVAPPPPPAPVVPSAVENTTTSSSGTPSLNS